jgi:hypothetical protein
MMMMMRHGRTKYSSMGVERVGLVPKQRGFASYGKQCRGVEPCRPAPAASDNLDKCRLNGGRL